MVLLGRMLVMTVACLAMALARPVTSLAEPEKDTAELARQVLETFGDDAQLDLDHEITVRGQAERGSADAQHELGALLATGRGTRQSYAEAAQWFQRAAEQGHGGAQYWLGNLYLRGMGVPRDKNRMVQWWRKAAIQGNISAQYALGAAYRDGRMVKQDITRAKAWFFMASGKTGRIVAGQKPMAAAKTAPNSPAAVAAEMRARRMESYKIEGPEGGR